MKVLTAFAVPALLLAAGHAAAQPVPPSHEQHQLSGRHEAMDSEKGCCCDEKMRKMMMEMMHKHQQGGMPQPKANSDRHAPAPDGHPHDR